MFPCRVHALFFTDSICCEPLTEWVHFADLRAGQPAYMEYLVRIMHALGVLCDDLCQELTPYAEAEPAAVGNVTPVMPRKQQLTDGIPWMLRDDRCAVSAGLLAHRLPP